MGKQWKQCQALIFWVPKSLQMVIAAMKLKDAYSFCTLRSRSDCEFQTLHLLSWVPSPERLVPGEAFLGSEHLCCFRWLLLWAVASLGPGVFAVGPLSSRAWCQLPEASAGGGRCFVPGRSLSWLNSPNPLRGLRNSMQVGPLIMRLRT